MTKFDSAHMKSAKVYAELSSAKRLQVGCVIVKDNTIIGIGYNGMPSGWDNVCEELKPQPFPHEPELVTRQEVIHAEINAISKVARSTNSSDGADMFVTCSPCIECAKLIHQSGIRRVFYGHTYRNDDGLKFLEKCNIETIQIKEQ